MEYINDRGEIIPLKGIGTGQIPTVQERLEVAKLSLPKGWRVVYDSTKLLLIASAPGWKTSGVQVVAKTVDELLARVGRVQGLAAAAGEAK